MREKWSTLVGFVSWLVTVSQVSGEVLTPPYFNLADGRRITATATCGEGTPEPELYCKLVGANADRDVNINLIQGQARGGSNVLGCKGSRRTDTMTNSKRILTPPPITPIQANSEDDEEDAKTIKMPPFDPTDVCDVCDPSRPDKMHPASFAIDGAETWWQSPPLSRSMKLNEVNLTIDFGQAFHVAYVFIRMANSPRPGIWALEKSLDNGLTFTPWQYFADTPADCETYFGKESLQPITKDDSVICDTQFSKVVPLEGGEIVVSLLNNRPSAKDFFNSTVLQEWTKATNVRLRFLRTKTLLGHLMSVARQDPTVTRRYFYSIKDISIGGRCMCNGHADTCDNTDPRDPYKLVCRCQHNTCGDQCQTCCRGYQQKAWKQSKANALFVCEQCNCYGHSDECEYSEEVDKQHLSVNIHGQYFGGGVCKNCRHNTEGINCHQCKSGYFRPFGRPLNATDVCERCQCDVYYSTGNCAEGTGQCECRKEYQEPKCDSCSFGYFGYPDCKPCECFQNGTRGYHCEAQGGACPCKPNFGGKFCYQCAEGFYDFPNCLSCDCNPIGSLSDVCAVDDGNCTCKNNFGGRSCDACKNGYYNYPECTYCSCDAHGTLEEVCDKDTGKCLCKEGFGGEKCDQCLPGFYGYPDCRPCNCSETGSSLTTCDPTGKCSCLFNFAGRVCDQCSPGYYQYPDCLSCECDHHGSIGVSCDNSGRCRCKSNFASDKCNACKEGFYNFPACEDCNCDPSGIIAGFAGCGSVPAGELCQCKSRVQGRICNECKPLYWNLKQWNPEGCEGCDCHIPGVLGGIGECDLHSGQCICKPGVESRRCDTCKDGFYGLNGDDLFGCTDCGCDIGGAIDRYCDKESGQCICQPRVTGRDCKQPHQAHYFPTLYSQLQFEAEDSHTPSGSPVRYDYSEHFFPNYSWKGYAIFSHLQEEIIHDIFINKPSLYRMIMKYVNPTNKTITGTIKIVPDNVNEVPQTFYVQLKPAKEPTLVTVSGPAGGIPSPLVMNPGQWAVHISTAKTIFLDYFVLLPAAFYEATILEERVGTPCTINGPSLCRHYSYPELDFDTANGESGYKPDDDLREPIQKHYKDFKHLNLIKKEFLPLLTANQSALGLDISISKPGRYVLLVNYVTPEEEWKTSRVSIETSTSSIRNKGIVELAPCVYDYICRQVSTDKLGRVAVYDLDTNFVGLTLRVNPDDNSTAVIQSVVAVPIEEWSLDYIRPKSVCIKKDGECLQTTFPVAPESTKIEFEQEFPDLVSNQTPSEVFDNNTAMIYLSGAEPTLDLHGTVPNPGSYVFVAHYFQPNHPEFSSDVIIQNGQVHEAKLMLPHCPGNAGCRSVIVQPDGNNQFNVEENFVLSFKKPDNKSLWFDYLMAIPADQFSGALLEEEAIDQTSAFISQCGNNHFDISPNTTGFCRDSVFSLTTQYYDGALKCECHYQGSLSFECEQFGGQCQCKENVIGRRCDMCKSGYFGFPNCRECSCPSPSTCHNETGECICPPKVTGPNCNECESKTFGYDVNYGCEDCNCHPDGVENNNLQCDLYTGVCQCKDNVRGRTCDRCKAGHYAFPTCLECACDRRGTTDDVCDEITSSCFCKNNVYGQACDLCKEGTFHINERNPNGCTKCFCFGKTTRCSSSSLYRSQIRSLENYQVAAVAASTTAVDVILVDPEEPEADVDNKVIYFVLPSGYLGNRLTSYGGFLNFTISFATQPFGDSVNGPDVILYGSDIYLLHYSLERPTEATPFSSFVEILESNFQVLTGLPATREQLMQVLGNLSAVFIRATYGTSRINPRLEEASLDIATRDFHPDATHALSVEQCHCPPNYQGLSCEECAPGFYRAQGGPFGGYCVPCQCNGHADTCDKVTGKCIDCKHNTYGDHCESCNVGYHGNATAGTPFDCLICACPLPIPTNNFATSCDVSEDGEHISCNCLPGYYGARCESCSAGYYGQPEVQGDSCKKCNCSGNINPDDPSSCDSITGECLKCLNNTFGAACNLCAPGYYGDAVVGKNCRSCDCAQCGTYYCQSQTGQCMCHENVVGERCDRCAEDHFGFNQCNGCYACNCGPASLESQCDDETGQCKCQPGVTGRTCDVCAPGFWNYSTDGCKSCGCNIDYSVGVGCNPVTGQCECLPGVIGDRCDQCPHRWVLIPDRGCFECNSCTHDLLDTTDYLRNLIDPVMTEFKTVADGYFTTQRLRYFNETANNLSVEVGKLDPSRLQMTPVLSELDALESDLKNIYRRAEFAKERGEKAAVDGEKVRVQTLDVEDQVREAADESGNAVLEVANLANSLDKGHGPHLESAVTESIDHLQDIQNRVLDPFIEKAEYELGNATYTRDKIKNFTIPIANQSRSLEMLRKAIEEFDDKLEDLRNQTASAQEISDKALLLNNMNKEAKLSSKVYTIKNMTKDANDTLANAKILLKNATEALEDARGATAELYREKNKGVEAKASLNATLLGESSELSDLHNPVEMAKVKADELFERAKQINESLAESRRTSGLGLEAARAYATIADDISNSEKSVKDANELADNALTQAEGIGNKTETAKDLSHDLLEQAMKALEQVQGDLQPQLEKAKMEVDEIEKQNMMAREQDENIAKELQAISNETNLESASQKAIKDSDMANSTAQNNLANIKTIIDKLPDEVVQAKQLPKDIGAIKHEVSQARSQLTRVNSILPDINQLMTNLKDTQMKLKDKESDVDKQIDRLKRQVAEARDLASRVNVGVTFQPNTFIEVKNPEDLAKQSTSTKVSAYFKSDKPNGALLYLGNEIGTNRKLKRAHTDDFLSVELENGHPAVVVDLGSGPHRINSDMNITLGKWYQFVVERTGKHVKMTVNEESDDGKEIKHVKEEVIPGATSILNLDPEESKIYVGGHPASAKIQSAVKYSSFDGQMENLVIGDTPISLWNFKDAEYTQGAQGRDKLINLSPSTGYRFNGNGYAVLDSRSYRMDTRSVVSLKFKTTANEGLLFLVGKGRYFLSLEIKDGKVVYQYNLGGGTAIFTTDDTFNDNRWHVVEATRQDQEGVLRVDDIERYKTNADGPGKYLHISDNMYVGGYPGKHHYETVTNMDFDGCIDDVHVDTTAVDLSKHEAAFGVLPGCPVQFSSLVALKEGQNAYIKYPNASANNVIDVSLRFKTQAQSGIILLTNTRDNADPFSIFLLNGELVVMSQGSILKSSDSPHYDDDQWHTITASHDAEGLKLSVDDYETFSNPSAGSPPSFKFGSLLVGGVPPSYFVSLSKVGTSSPFVGCIADVTFNGVLINFANSTDFDGVTIGRCSEAESEEAVIIPHGAPFIPTEDEVLDKMPKFPLPPDYGPDREPGREVDEDFDKHSGKGGVEGGRGGSGGRGRDGERGRGKGKDREGGRRKDKDREGGRGRDRDRGRGKGAGAGEGGKDGTRGRDDEYGSQGSRGAGGDTEYKRPELGEGGFDYEEGRGRDRDFDGKVGGDRVGETDGGHKWDEEGRHPDGEYGREGRREEERGRGSDDYDREGSPEKDGGIGSRVPLGGYDRDKDGSFRGESERDRGKEEGRGKRPDGDYDREGGRGGWDAEGGRRPDGDYDREGGRGGWDAEGGRRPDGDFGREGGRGGWDAEGGRRPDGDYDREGGRGGWDAEGSRRPDGDYDREGGRGGWDAEGGRRPDGDYDREGARHPDSGYDREGGRGRDRGPEKERGYGGDEHEGDGIIGRVNLDGDKRQKEDDMNRGRDEDMMEGKHGKDGSHRGGETMPGIGENEGDRQKGTEMEGERDIDNELEGSEKDMGGEGRSHGEKMDKKHKKLPPTPKPTPMGLCALPLDPASDPNASFQNGYQFGTQNGSRIEFASLPGRNKNAFDYTLDFKTHYPDGLLFYASDKGHIDFAALYIKGGKLFFGFNCGSGAALITSPESYDDGNWHSVRITRENTLGQLIVDGQNPISGESSGNTKTLNVVSPYYLGGFDPAIIESAKHNIQGLNQSFAGCIRKFQANNKEVKPSMKKGVVPCSEHTEPGIFFASGGGFVRAVDSFRVGTNIEIKMQIKPRSTSGVLLAVHGKKDYLFLQMVNGVIEFTVDNGRGPFTSAYKPGDEYFFCDGRWHFIHAVQAKNVIVLSVDSFSVEPGIGTPGSTVTDTKHPLYLGSAGPRGYKLRGNLTSHQYVGCMREVIINSNLLKINTHRAVGNVTVSSCPTI